MGIITGPKSGHCTVSDMDACKDLVDSISKENTLAVFTIVVVKDDQGIHFKGKCIDKTETGDVDSITDILMDELEDFEECIDEKITVLSNEDVAVVVDALNDPPEPNGALKAAFKRHAQLVGDHDD